MYGGTYVCIQVYHTSKLLNLSQDVSDSYTDYDGAKQPDDHLRMSLLALLCCFPCGIIALCNSMKVFSVYICPFKILYVNCAFSHKAIYTMCYIQVNRLFSKGKHEEALKASERAELCSTRAFTCMLVFVLCQFLLFLSGLVLLICFAFDCIKTSCHW